MSFMLNVENEKEQILGQSIFCIPTDREDCRHDQARFDGGIVGERLCQTSWADDGRFTATIADELFDVLRHNLGHAMTVEAAANERLSRRHSIFSLRCRLSKNVLVFKSLRTQTLEVEDEISFELP